MRAKDTARRRSELDKEVAETALERWTGTLGRVNHATPRVIVHTKLKGAIKLGKHLQFPSGHHPETPG